MVGHPIPETTTMKLSDTQRVILSEASQHAMGFARAPKTLPAAARNAVFRSLIKNNLLIEINASREHVGLGWRQDDDGTWIVARITDEGLRAIGVDPNEGDAVADTAPTGATDDVPGETPAPETLANQAAPVAIAIDDPALADQPAARANAASWEAVMPKPKRSTLRDAATALLAAWGDEANRDVDMIGALEGPMATLRAALADKPTRDAGAARKPREGTKQEAVLAMLRRPEGATVAQVADAMGWATHTVRGFLAGLKKKGHTVEVLERIRQVGPNKEGARGSYTVYRIGG
jgi:hypothetical protein